MANVMNKSKAFKTFTQKLVENHLSKTKDACFSGNQLGLTEYLNAFLFRSSKITKSSLLKVTNYKGPLLKVFRFRNFLNKLF